MKTNRGRPGNAAKLCLTVVVLLVGLLLHAQAYAVTLSVVDPGGNGVAGYRWLLEDAVGGSRQSCPTWPRRIAVQRDEAVISHGPLRPVG